MNVKSIISAGTVAVAAFALSAASCEDQVHRVQQAVQDSGGPVDVKNIYVPNLDVQVDCDTMTVVLEGWEPADEFAVGYGSPPPASVHTDSNGDYTQTFDADSAHGVAIGWSVSDDGVMLGLGTVYCS